jgi:hypothetical protein
MKKFTIVISLFIVTHIFGSAVGRFSDIPIYLATFQTESIDNNSWKITPRNLPFPVKIALEKDISASSYLNCYDFQKQPLSYRTELSNYYSFTNGFTPTWSNQFSRKKHYEDFWSKRIFFSMSGAMGNETKDPMISGYNDGNSKWNVDRKGVINKYQAQLWTTKFVVQNNVVLGGVHKTDWEEYERVKFANKENRGRWDYYHYDINFQKSDYVAVMSYEHDECYSHFHPILSRDIPLDTDQYKFEINRLYNGYPQFYFSYSNEEINEYNPLNPLNVDFKNQQYDLIMKKLSTEGVVGELEIQHDVYQDINDSKHLTIYKGYLEIEEPYKIKNIKAELELQYEDNLGLMFSGGIDYSFNKELSLKYFYAEKHPYEIEDQTYLRYINIDLYENSESIENNGKPRPMQTHYFEAKYKKSLFTDFVNLECNIGGNYSNNLFYTDLNYSYDHDLASDPIVYWNEHGFNIGLTNNISYITKNFNLNFTHYLHLYDEGSDIFKKFMRTRRPSWSVGSKFKPYADLHFQLSFIHKPQENWFEFRNIDHVANDYCNQNVTYIDHNIKAKDILSARIDKAFIYNKLWLGLVFEHLLNESEPFHPLGVRRDLTIWVCFNLKVALSDLNFKD